MDTNCFFPMAFRSGVHKAVALRAQCGEGDVIMATIKMPFGKYRGKRIISVPAEYLHWLLDNSEELDADLRRAVEQELDRRGEPHAEPKTEAEEKPAKKPKA